jgi:hypothetical protein
VRYRYATELQDKVIELKLDVKNRIIVFAQYMTSDPTSALKIYEIMFCY